MTPKKLILIPFILLFLFLLTFFGLPTLIHHHLNSQGETGSKIVKTHIDELFMVLPFHFKMKGLVVKMRTDGKTIFEGRDSQIGLDFEEIKKGRFLFWGDIKEYHLQYAPEYTEGLKEIRDYILKTDPDIKFSRIKIKESSIVVTRYSGVNKDKYFTLHDLRGHLNNLQPTKAIPVTKIILRAILYGETKLKLSLSQHNLTPAKDFDLDFILEKMQLADLNLILKKELPLIFKSGTLDLYAEAKSQNGNIEGYLKPFLHDVVIDDNDPDRKNPGHFLLSLVTTFFKKEKLKSFSTRVPLKMKAPMKIEYGEMLKKIYEKGFENKETPGLEHSVKLTEEK
jgi:hypothetical protein